MERNEGTVDRAVRLLLGVALLALGGLQRIPYPKVAILLGVVLLVTGIVGVCPLYSVLKIKTCGEKC